MIDLLNVRKVSGPRTLLDIEAFSVAAGQSVAVSAAPGGGAEVLLDLLLGRSRPTTGVVRIAGLDPFADRAVFSRRVGVLFSDDSLYRTFSAEENLAFFAGLYGLSRTRQQEVLALVGLGDQAKTPLNQLAPGAQRRLALGRALLHSPSDLLLVEPFVRCDEASIQIIATLIRQLSASGAAVLVFAAESARLSGVCDPVYLFQQGRLAPLERPSTGEATARPFKIPVRLEGRVALINPLDIWYAEAQGDSACIHTSEGRLPTQYTLSELEERLGRSGFFRAHRGYLVNLQHVKEVIPFTRSSFSLRLDDPAGTLIPLSKTAAAELRLLLEY
jgi:ABC-2 type transport system ATP-binding protein